MTKDKREDPRTPAYLSVKTTTDRRLTIQDAKTLWPDERMSVTVFRALREAIRLEKGRRMREDAYGE